jgi:dihydrodipicolinate synthase/N-acetylneuraminate lyase
MKIQGVIPVMMLPLHSDESIDEGALRKQVDFAVAGGAAAVCAPGFATEFYKLTDEERRWVIKVVVEQTGGRVPMFAGTGCGSVRATIELSRYAESVGAAGLMVAAPKFCPLGALEQTAFFESVCRNVGIPVMLQDADFTGAGLPAGLIVDLAERCPNLEFAKLENILPGAKCSEIIRLSGGRVQVLYGMAGIALLDGLAHGATGVMPGPSFIEAYVHVFELYGGNRIPEAKALFYRMQPYVTFSMQHLELVIRMDKRGLVRRGIFSSDRVREPTLCFDAEYQKQMDELIELMDGICQEIQADRPRFAGTPLRPS